MRVSRTITPHPSLRQANRTTNSRLLHYSIIGREGNSDSGYISVENIVSYTNYFSKAVLLPCQDGRSGLSFMGRHDRIHLRPGHFGRFYDLSLSLPPSDSLLEPTSPRCSRHATIRATSSGQLHPFASNHSQIDHFLPGALRDPIARAGEHGHHPEGSLLSQV